MAKKLIKEIIIALLIALAMIVILGVLLYRFIPSNKVLPSDIEYNASDVVKEQLKEAIESQESQVVLSYEVTQSDLKNYQKSNSYNAGKVNPFSSYNVQNNQSETSNNDINDNTDSNQNSSSSGDLNNQNTGTFFENDQGIK